MHRLGAVFEHLQQKKVVLSDEVTEETLAKLNTFRGCRTICFYDNDLPLFRIKAGYLVL